MFAACGIATCGFACYLIGLRHGGLCLVLYYLFGLACDRDVLLWDCV